MHILLYGVTKLVRAHRLENKELHERTPLSTNILLIGRVEFICEDLAFVKTFPTNLIHTEVTHEWVEERVTM